MTASEHAPATAGQRRLTSGFVTKELRARALHVARRKLSGDNRREATAWIRARHRKPADLEKFIERVDPERKGEWR